MTRRLLSSAWLPRLANPASPPLRLLTSEQNLQSFNKFINVISAWLMFYQLESVTRLRYMMIMAYSFCPFFLLKKFNYYDEHAFIEQSALLLNY